jgi:hypothetical protein
VLYLVEGCQPKIKVQPFEMSQLNSDAAPFGLLAEVFAGEKPVLGKDVRQIEKS